MIISKTKRLTVLATGILIAGCGIGMTSTDSEPKLGSFEYLTAPRVIYQVCLPTKTVSFQDVEIDLTGVAVEKPLLEQRKQYSSPLDPISQDEERYAKKAARHDVDDLRNKDIVRQVVLKRMTDIKWGSIGAGQVKRWGEIQSDSAEHLSLIGATDADQPVFELHGDRPETIISFHTYAGTNHERVEDLIEYWFKLPKSIPSNEYSAWQLPISEETYAEQHSSPYAKDDSLWRLFHGQEVEIHRVSENAPRIRYRLVSILDYTDSKRFWLRSQRALYTKYLENKSSEEKKNFVFIPKDAVPIPRC